MTVSFSGLTQPIVHRSVQIAYHLPPESTTGLKQQRRSENLGASSHQNGRIQFHISLVKYRHNVYI